VGETMLLSFHGTRAPAYVLRILRRGDAAGVFLARENVVAPAQLRALTHALHGARRGVLVATDQEGGAARTIPWIGPAAGQPDSGSAAAVRASASAAGRELRAAGVDIDLAPVADVPSGSRAFVAPRAYTGTPGAVAARVGAAVEGLRAGGVDAAVKHFPGLGGATASTDDGPATLQAVPPLAPFRAAITAGARLVMAGHALYPALDPRHIASQSPVILGALLRRRLGFRGVIVTDSMEARAVLARSSLEQAAIRSIRAGADLLLLTGPGSWIRVDRALRTAAARSPALRARLRAAARRVQAL